jgi:hypothetical protein
MAGKDDDQIRDIEDDNDITPEVQGDDDEKALRDILMKALDDADADQDEDVFSGPIKSRERKTVSLDEGLDLIDKADKSKRASAKTDDDEEDDPDPLNPKAATPKAEEAAPGEEAKAAEPAPADVDTLLDGIDGDKRTAIAARIAAGDEVLGLFKGQEERLQSLGVTPKEAVSNLLKIEQYARSNPHEYIAWAAGQMAPGKAHELLGRAAEIHGYKLVPVAADGGADEDDPFEDEEKKAMRKELRELKAAQAHPPQIGPDAPEVRARRDLESFVSAKDTEGRPLRPFFKELAKDMAEKAKTHRDSTGQDVTAADLERFYGELEEPYLASKGLPPRAAAQPKTTDAAQAQAPVADKTKQAAALERSRAASKSIDGTGQGAGRRPALSDEASLREIVTEQVDRYFTT